LGGGGGGGGGGGRIGEECGLGEEEEGEFLLWVWPL